MNSCWIKKLCDLCEWNASTPPQSAVIIFPLSPGLIHYLRSSSHRCHTQEWNGSLQRVFWWAKMKNCSHRLSGSCTCGALWAVPVKEASFTLSFRKKFGWHFALGKFPVCKCDVQNMIQTGGHWAGVILWVSAALPVICLLRNWAVIFIPMQLQFFHLP